MEEGREEGRERTTYLVEEVVEVRQQHAQTHLTVGRGDS